MKRHTRFAAARDAFTMMEVLVVIVILSVLLALTTTVVKRVMVAADERKTKANMAMAMEAVKVYWEQHGSYPSSIAVLMNHANCQVCRRILGNLPSGTVSESGVKDGFDTVMTYSASGGPNNGPMFQSLGADGVVSKDDLFYP